MIRRILALGDPSREATRRAIRRSLPALRRLGSVRVALKTRRIRPGEADLAVVFGGDGAILNAARQLAPAGIPLVGINLGKLGFLTEVDLSRVGDLARRLAQGRYAVVDAMMLDCAVFRRGRVVCRDTALNDAVLGGSGISRMVSLELRIDGRPVGTYSGDGLIVATPSGSTAHSLSAGGPILAPGVEALVLTPLAPHTLSHRPLLVAPSSRIAVNLPANRHGVSLTLDGQRLRRLREGDRIEIARSSRPCRFVLLHRQAYFSTLRRKLHWGQ